MAIKTRRFISSYRSCSCSMPGVWRAVTYCHGMVVIFHSPRACAHVARTMDINFQYRNIAEGHHELEGSIPLISSQLEEKHSIFGGIERLLQCIDFVMKEYKPKCLVIANSCVAGVIGDDVNAAAKETEEKYKIPVLTVDCCGFLDGEYYQGYFSITEKLVDKFLLPCTKKPGTVLLLGDNGGPWGHYATEVTRLLKKMGIDVVGQFPGYMDFEDLPKAASAEAMIILGGRGQTYIGLKNIAKKMREKLDLPFLDIYPVGWENITKWIVAVGELLHKEEEAKTILAEELTFFNERLSTLQKITQGKKVVLCIGRLLMYYHPAAVLETIKLLKLNLTGIILLDMYSAEDKQEMLDTVKSCTDVEIFSPAEGENLLREADLVLTTHELQNKVLKQIFLPMLPKVGITGELEFMHIIYQTLCSRIKGGIRYV